MYRSASLSSSSSSSLPLSCVRNFEYEIGVDAEELKLHRDIQCRKLLHSGVTQTGEILLSPVKASKQQKEQQPQQPQDQPAASTTTTSDIRQVFLERLEGVFRATPWAVEWWCPRDSGGNILAGCTATRERIHSIVLSSLKECEDDVTNPNHPKSEVFALNEHPVNTPFRASPSLWELITLAVSINNCAPCFDVTVAARLRRYEDEILRVGNPTAFVAASAPGGATFKELFRVNEKARTITRCSEAAEIDFGPIAKGWVVDVAFQRIVGTGCGAARLSYGSVSRSFGTDINHRPWLMPVYVDNNSKNLLLRVMPIPTRGAAFSLSCDTSHPIQRTRHAPFIDAISGVLREATDGDDVALAAVMCPTAAMASALSVVAMAMNNPELFHDRVERHWTVSSCPVLDCVHYCRANERLVCLRRNLLEKSWDRDRALSTCSAPKIAVVGGGIAGLTVALEAAQCGAKVTVLEARRTLGGVAHQAVSGIAIPGCCTQRSRKVLDGIDLLLSDITASTSSKQSQRQQSRLMSLAANTDECLENTVWERSDEMSMDVVSVSCGHTLPRVVRNSREAFAAVTNTTGSSATSSGMMTTGSALVEQLTRTLTSTRFKDNVNIVTGAKTTGLVHETLKDEQEDFSSTHVVGVVYELGNRVVEMHCDVVVLATGGYHNNPDTLRNFVVGGGNSPTLTTAAGADGNSGGKSPPREPSPPGSPTLNISTNTNTMPACGIALASASDGVLVDMECMDYSLVAKSLQKASSLSSLPSSRSLHHISAASYNIPPALLFEGAALVLGAGASEGSVVRVFPPNEGRQDRQRRYRAGTYTQIAKDVSLRVPQKEAFIILDATSVDALSVVGNLNHWLPVGYYNIHTSVEELAHFMHRAVDSVFEEVMSYFGPTATTFYTCRVRSTKHYSCGGVCVTPTGEVLAHTKSSSSIDSTQTVPGLLAVGEATGGLHGSSHLEGVPLL
eukprot:PhM_4_TR7628/c1_g1_i1/m.56292